MTSIAPSPPAFPAPHLSTSLRARQSITRMSTPPSGTPRASPNVFSVQDTRSCRGAPVRPLTLGSRKTAAQIEKELEADAKSRTDRSFTPSSPTVATPPSDAELAARRDHRIMAHMFLVEAYRFQSEQRQRSAVNSLSLRRRRSRPSNTGEFVFPLTPERIRLVAKDIDTLLDPKLDRDFYQVTMTALGKLKLFRQEQWM